MIGVALYFQYIIELEPCPLCILQRLVVMGLGLIGLVAALHNPAATGRRIYAALLALTAATGIGISLRHVWLQNQPKPLFAECGGGLNQMLETMPLGDVLATVLRGTGDCSDTVWSLLGISIPGWTAMAFAVFFFLAGWMFLQAARTRAAHV